MRSILMRLLLFTTIWGLAPDSVIAQTPKYIGAWSSGTFEGFGAALRRECAYVSVTERHLRLTLVPGTTKVEGEWLRVSKSMWMNTDNRTCRWTDDSTQLEAIYYAQWDYLLKGEFDATRGVLIVDGEFAVCAGNACRGTLGSTTTKPFHTELKVIGNRLVDTNGTADTSDDIEFIRVSDQADKVEEARASLDRYLPSLDSGDAASFYSTACSSGFRTGMTREQFMKITSDFQARTGYPVSRHNMTTLYVIYAPAISKIPGDYLFIANGMHTSKKMGGLEYFVLVKEGSAWKVLWINYGS